MRSTLRAAASILASLLVASMGVTAVAARCDTCTSAPCCAIKDSSQAHLIARMPCCATSTRTERVTRTVVALDEAPLFLPALRLDYASADAFAIGAREFRSHVQRVRPLYRTKCALLL